MENENRSDNNWKVFGKRFPKWEIVYFIQVIILLIVIIAALVNLTLYKDDKKLWIALLSSSIGYILPNPKIKFNNVK